MLHVTCYVLRSLFCSLAISITIQVMLLDFYTYDREVKKADNDLVVSVLRIVGRS
jgi:hypothetical protein